MSEERLHELLRESLRREDAPPDFAAKVLAKAPAPKMVVIPKLPKSWWRRPATFALAAALAGMVIIPTVIVEQHRREQERGLKAKQDLMTALAITREQFGEAKVKLRQTTGDTE